MSRVSGMVIEAQVTFLSQLDGGRRTIAIADGRYRPHVVVEEPAGGAKEAGSEEYLGVGFEGDGRYLVPGSPHPVTLVPLFPDRVDYGALVEGVSFTIREGGRVVGHGVVVSRSLG